MKPAEFDAFTELLDAVFECYGKPLKDGAITLWWNAFGAYELSTVRNLLNLHVRESKFAPTIAELMDRLRAMDGRPNAEEAWAICARSLNDEGVTIVWTEEMAQAFGVALGLQNDRVAARMAFKETYENAVREARRHGKSAKWSASLGHDPNGREGPLVEALRKNLLPAQYVAGLLPHRDQPSPEVAALLTGTQKALAA